MTDRATVVRFPTGGADHVPFAFFVCALGYEARATYAAEQLVDMELIGSKRVAIDFANRKTISYADNAEWFEANGFQLVEFRSGAVRNDIAQRVQSLWRERDRQVAFVVGVDISSMSRVMMAEVVLALEIAVEDDGLQVEFVYSPATYSMPETRNPVITSSGPVVPEFAGWSDPNLPAVVVLGLGYEYDRAVGTVETLDPASTWALMPVGEDPRFERSIMDANQDLTDLLPEGRIAEYKLDHPMSLFVRLESLVSGLLRDSRPVIVPLGPKIFALVSLLIGMVHRPNVTIWRVSGDQAEQPVDSVPSGKLVRLRVEIARE